jgi:hypothetical protein
MWVGSIVDADAWVNIADIPNTKTTIASEAKPNPRLEDLFIFYYSKMF